MYLRRVFNIESFAKMMSWHAVDGKFFGDVDREFFPDHPPVLADVCQGRACEKIQEMHPFCDDPRHVMFILATDGVNMFKGDHAYSAWPLVLTPINLPPWLRKIIGVTTVLGLVPGTREKRTLSLDSIKCIIADEIRYLQKYGCDVNDASKPEGQRYFRCHVSLAHIVSDSRGNEKMFGTLCVPGRHACLQCWQEGFKIHGRGKTIYPGMGRYVSF
jgi:hypothetical protein